MSKVICIDAGHGGTDPGAVNGRYKESEATLGIANKIADKLKAKGHRVVLTRTKDQALLLQQRCDISNAAKADAFISIHCNSAENKDASGIETFKYPGVGGVTKRLAENIQNGLASSFPEEKDRGVKEAKYYVLKHTNAPAALVEVGFISHSETAEKLFRFSYQDKLARVIAEGIERTFYAV